MIVNSNIKAKPQYVHAYGRKNTFIQIKVSNNKLNTHVKYTYFLLFWL